MSKKMVMIINVILLIILIILSIVSVKYDPRILFGMKLL